MTGTALYFAYGSNLSVVRLRARIPEARVVSVARMQGYRLAFHKRSLKDGSGKCNAFCTNRPEDQLLGVVYEIPVAAWPGLDVIEGPGYERRSLTVECVSGDTLTVQTYIGIIIEEDLLPMDWYRHHVLLGAREHGFPPDYVAAIEAVPVQSDPEPARAAREFALHPATMDS